MRAIRGKSEVWVQLAKSKYLKRRKKLDFKSTRGNVSWVWGGIQKCSDILNSDVCYRIGRNSKVAILKDPVATTCRILDYLKTFFCLVILAM